MIKARKATASVDAEPPRNAEHGVLGGESGFFVQRVVIKASKATQSLDCELQLNAEHGVLGGESVAEVELPA